MRLHSCFGRVPIFVIAIFPCGIASTNLTNLTSTNLTNLTNAESVQSSAASEGIVITAEEAQIISQEEAFVESSEYNAESSQDPFDTLAVPPLPEPMEVEQLHELVMQNYNENFNSPSCSIVCPGHMAAIENIFYAIFPKLVQLHNAIIDAVRAGNGVLSQVNVPGLYTELSPVLRSLFVNGSDAVCQSVEPSQCLVDNLQSCLMDPDVQSVNLANAHTTIGLLRQLCTSCPNAVVVGGEALIYRLGVAADMFECRTNATCTAERFHQQSFGPEREELVPNVPFYPARPVAQLHAECPIFTVEACVVRLFSSSPGFNWASATEAEAFNLFGGPSPSYAECAAANVLTAEEQQLIAEAQAIVESSMSSAESSDDFFHSLHIPPDVLMHAAPPPVEQVHQMVMENYHNGFDSTTCNTVCPGHTVAVNNLFYAIVPKLVQMGNAIRDTALPANGRVSQMDMLGLYAEVSPALRSLFVNGSSTVCQSVESVQCLADNLQSCLLQPPPPAAMQDISDISDSIGIMRKMCTRCSNGVVAGGEALIYRLGVAVDMFECRKNSTCTAEKFHQQPIGPPGFEVLVPNVPFYPVRPLAQFRAECPVIGADHCFMETMTSSELESQYSLSAGRISRNDVARAMNLLGGPPPTEAECMAAGVSTNPQPQPPAVAAPRPAAPAPAAVLAALHAVTPASATQALASQHIAGVNDVSAVSAGNLSTSEGATSSLIMTLNVDNPTGLADDTPYMFLAQNETAVQQLRMATADLASVDVSYVGQPSFSSNQTTVHSVNATVHSVNATVHSANATVHSVNATVHSRRLTGTVVQVTVPITTPQVPVPITTQAVIQSEEVPEEEGLSVLILFVGVLIGCAACLVAVCAATCFAASGGKAANRGVKYQDLEEQPEE